MGKIRTAAELKSNVVLTARVKDYRISHEERIVGGEKVKVKKVDKQTNPNDILDIQLKWPDLAYKECQGIWSQGERRESVKGMMKESALQELRSRKRKRDMDIVLGEAAIGDVISMDKEDKSGIPIMLIVKHGSLQRGFGSGWDVVLPKGWGLPFWKMCMYRGVCPVGRKELEMIYLEQGAPYFPRDYPMSECGKEFWKQEGEKRKEVHERRPKGKRPNFEKMNVKSPFQPDWSLVMCDHGSEKDSLVFVQLKAARGTPQDGAMIEIEKEAGSSEKKLIGFLTSAGFSYIRGMGFGVGYVSQHGLNTPLANGEKIEAYYRNVKSMHSHKCVLKVSKI